MKGHSHVGNDMKHKTHTVIAAILAMLLLATATALSAGEREADIMRDGRITLTLREVSIAEVMEMLSRAGKVSILLADGVEAQVSVNLFDIRYPSLWSPRLHWQPESV